MIYSMKFEVEPEHDVLIPPFTSKLGRQILVNMSKSYSEIVHDPRPYKPVRVSVIKDINERPIFFTGKEKVVLNGRAKYYFTFSFIGNSFFEEILQNPQQVLTFWQTKFRVQLVDVKITENVEIEDARLYKISFLTPTLLQPIRPPIKRKKNRFILFPCVPYLISSILRHWNSNSDEKISNVLSSKTLYYFREVDYRLRPITAYYGNKPVRGFVGWTIYQLSARKNSKLRDNIRKLLGYANYLGVGKSRAIGFGEVKVTPLTLS
ncbi:CRISPR-associated endoribonuclease Cas6 [Sulfolobus sp. A20]|nr:CRISPR-associated endoribonuclease Cas6 [Sulfolobus sp. A20]TRM74434.1 CRISPR-associated endoribonuclease Cas6 [Sulfolobus sp. E5]TRM77718.1 CRISPR-associated endoribonuclease Cas6 [Sulfolobus sp. A20-N-F8]TRM78983.1 CRISPR-associated endoribonuclease Cas6 [Sulfolobus sp. B5]TRM80375.1 CRISPR-associated endoribonuclease Cas6 [Sulfolobus sp. D5]TRM81994.1 CRISPR-associated endoribonuclease Cas6 [Sulfolobus sp. A20-N-F6]TRM86677.1 CRISPR-associated endoribonuclease Cas6 [Sulfolobus sp. C3]T